MSDHPRYDHLKELCEHRRSRRQFEDTPISKDMISKILSIASTSPYASGKKNWEVLVLEDREILRRMGEAVREKTSLIVRHLDDEYADGFRQYASNFLFFETAPALFVLSFRVQRSISLMMKDDMPDYAMAPKASGGIDVPRTKDLLGAWERDSQVKSISCVAMLILLAAESLGLGACYMTGPLIAEAEIAKLLQLKKGRSIGAIIPVGYYSPS
jgi:nitroreductase